MAQVISFVDFIPPARYDGIPWTDYQIEEADASDGVFVLIDSGSLSPVDSDPEHPAVRSFTTELASDTDGLWYRIVFLDGTGDDTLPTTPIQNILSDTTSAYATTTELFRILKIRNPSSEQTVAAERVLLAAAGEINSEIDLADDDSLAGWERALCAEVNLERAVEHWRQQEAPFGLIGLGPELPAERTARDSWERHAHKLAPLKSQWGLA